MRLHAPYHNAAHKVTAQKNLASKQARNQQSHLVTPPQLHAALRMQARLPVARVAVC
jgi:hypothetical protein